MWWLFVLAGLIGGLECEGVRSKRDSGAQPLTVGFRLEAPFFQESSTGNYEGFLPDLLEAVASDLDVEFTYQQVDDVYGVVENGNLTGLLGMVQREEVDLAAGPITITHAREALVDFSKPFMSSSIRGLVKRPQAPYSTSRMFAYLRPLSAGAWVVLILCTVLTGVLLYINTKFHPKETAGVAKRQSIGGEGRRLADAFWWIMRSFALQGAENRPKSIAGRIICVVWIFFILDSLFLYLATLIHNIPAYYGPSPAPKLPFDSVQGLADSGYHYGTRSGTSTAAFFADSHVPIPSQVDLYQTMNSNMIYLDSVEEGLAGVQEGNFVFFVESIADYYSSKDCSLQVTPFSLNSVGLGLAFPQGSNLRDNVSMEVLQLQEDGKLSMLYNKWFKSGEACPVVEDDADNTAPKVTPITLGMDSYGGPVLILFLGMLVALLVAIMEVLVIRKRTQTYDVEEGKDGENMPILAQEEGQAVQYEDENKPKEEDEQTEDEDKKDDEEKKEEVIKAEEADDIKSAPTEEDDEDVKKPIPDSDEDDKKTDDEETKDDEKEEEKKEESDEAEDKKEKEAVKDEARKEENEKVIEEEPKEEEKNDEEPEKKEDSESKDTGTEKDAPTENNDKTDELKIEEDQNKAEATS